MADNPETSLWEPGIYQLEQTDDVIGGLGGVSNQPNVELGNRTKKIYDVLVENSIYIDEGDHKIAGLNIDVTAVFEAGVSNGQAVFYDNAQSRYELAQAPTWPAGIADVTNGRVISGGMVLISSIGGTTVAGDNVYLSGATPGGIRGGHSSVCMGKVLWKTGTNSGVISLNLGGSLGEIFHSEITDDETEKHYLEANIRHSILNNDEPSIHTSLGDLIGHITMFVAGTSPPVNYLHCNGALISKTTYASLYTGQPFSIGNRFGESGGSFYLPDFRGRVPRGWANGSGRDPDRASRYADHGGITGDSPGSMQNDQFESHLHPPSAGFANFMSTTGSSVGSGGDSYGRMDNTGYQGGNETRMHNFGAMWIIRYQ